MKRLITFFLLSTLTFCLIGFYFESNDELQCDLLFRGFLTSSPVGEIRALFPFLSSFFSYFYSIFPSVPIYAISHLLSLGLYCFLIDRLLRHTETDNSLFPNTFAVHFLLFALTILPLVLSMEMTRWSILIPFLCSLLILVEEKKKYILFYVLLLLVYSLVRAQSHLLVFAFISLVFVVRCIMHLQGNRARFIFVAVSMAVVSSLIHLHTTFIVNTDPFCKNEVAYVKDVVDFHCLYPFKSRQDSITFEVLDNWLMADRKWLTEARLSQITHGKLFSLYKVRQKYYDFWENWAFLLLASKYLIVSVLCLLIAFNYWKAFGTKAWPFFFYLFSFGAMAGTLTVLMKMPNRIAEPLILCLLFGALCLRPKEIRFSFGEQKALLLCFLPFLCFSVWEHKDLPSSASLHSQTWREMENGICGKQIIYGNLAMGKFDGYPIFETPPLHPCNKYLSIGGWTGWLPETLEQIQSFTGSKDVATLFEMHPDRIWLLADSEVTVYERLVERAYDKSIKFKLFALPTPYMKQAGLAWYVIEQI